MHIQQDNDEFASLIESWVAKAVSRNVISFGQLITTLPSVYPTLVLDALRRLVQKRTIPSWVLANAVRQVRLSKTSTDLRVHSWTLPIPHPLDYDWRFSTVAAERLLRGISNVTSSHDHIILIGTPSILRHASCQGIDNFITLLDNNPKLVNQIKSSVTQSDVTLCDVTMGQLPNVSGAAVVIDPPWYMEYLETFLWSASQLCKQGGHIFLSAPPIGTRASIPQEMEDLQRWARELGLILVQSEPNTLPYHSPPFERSALKAAGIHRIPSEWRRGNLLIYKKILERNAARPILPQQEAWSEESVNSVRFRIRQDGRSRFGDPSFVSFIPGDVLPTVSRQDSRRAFVDVWTSGNRVFQCQGVETLQHVLAALSMGQPVHPYIQKVLGRVLDSPEVALVSRLICTVEELIEQESAEYLEFGEGLW